MVQTKFSGSKLRPLYVDRRGHRWMCYSFINYVYNYMNLHTVVGRVMCDLTVNMHCNSPGTGVIIPNIFFWEHSPSTGLPYTPLRKRTRLTIPCPSLNRLLPAERPHLLLTSLTTGLLISSGMSLANCAKTAASTNLMLRLVRVQAVGLMY